MKKFKLTKSTVEKLPLAEKGKQVDYYDSELDGFGLRVSHSGKKYFVRRLIGTKRTRVMIGSHPIKTAEAARDEAIKVLGSMESGIDPNMQKREQLRLEKVQSQALTISELITEYITKHAKPSKKSWRDDERILKKDALVTWGKCKAADIKKRDVVLLLESIVERGSPGSANNNFKIIRKMFRFAVQRDILEHSPCDGVVMPAPLNRGDRVLTAAEIKTLWGNLDTCHISPEVRRAIRLILVTGQRPGEVIGIHTSEIGDRWWTIPAERSKNKKAHRVYLTYTALALIDGLTTIDKKSGEEKDKGFIFACVRPRKNNSTEQETKTKKVQPMWRQAPAKAIKRNLAVPVLVKGKPVFDADGLPVTENKLEVADFTPHDLRRTAATFMSQLGFMDEVIDAVLNHTKQGVIATYNLNRYDREKQQALEAWERKLNSIITGTVSKVIPITRNAA
ncbi:MAG: site-specific integrase [Desulfuromonadales bacterium]